MVNTTSNASKSLRDIAYYKQRYRNRVFTKLVTFIADQCERAGLTKKDIAKRLNKDPVLISRWLSQPSNLTLNTIAELLLALDAEAEPPEIILFKDRHPPNYMHPLMARALNVSPNKTSLKVDSAGALEASLSSLQMVTMQVRD